MPKIHFLPIQFYRLIKPSVAIFEMATACGRPIGKHRQMRNFRAYINAFQAVPPQKACKTCQAAVSAYIDLAQSILSERPL